MSPKEFKKIILKSGLPVSTIEKGIGASNGCIGKAIAENRALNIKYDQPLRDFLASPILPVVVKKVEEVKPTVYSVDVLPPAVIENEDALSDEAKKNLNRIRQMEVIEGFCTEKGITVQTLLDFYAEATRVEVDYSSLENHDNYKAPHTDYAKYLPVV